MRKIKYKKGRKTSIQPLEYTGIHKENATEMQLFVYDELTVKEFQKMKLVDFTQNKEHAKCNWLNLHGLNNVELIESITSQLNINSVLVADILNIHRGTKYVDQDDTLFFSIKSILPSKDASITIEQISFLVQGNVLVSFQEKRGDFFTHIRERITDNIGIVRKKKVDYLLYLLLDAIIENFYITIEKKEDDIEVLVAKSKKADDPKVMENIEEMREIFHLLKRAIVPVKESLFTIKTTKEDAEFLIIEEGNYLYFDRLHQKTIELLDQIEYDLNMLESASNFFYTTQNHKMNEVMKTLTVISSVFLPLTFIVCVYGMNFENMPEIKMQNGYFVVLGLMVLIVLLMLYYFKRKHWF